jgi:hypothetical protein
MLRKTTMGFEQVLVLLLEGHTGLMLSRFFKRMRAIHKPEMVERKNRLPDSNTVIFQW